MKTMSVKELLKNVRCEECGAEIINDIEYVCKNCGLVYSLDDLYELYYKEDILR